MKVKYKTITSDKYEPKEKFDNRLNYEVSQGWQIAGDLQASQYQGGSFLGYTSDTILSILLKRDFSEEELKSIAEHQSNRRKKDEEDAITLRNLMVVFALCMAFIWALFLIFRYGL